MSNSSSQARSFSRQYSNIEKYVEFEFLKDLIAEIDSYVNGRAAFMEKINARLRTILNEVYAERNLEVITIYRLI